jgi:nicotinate phosphoribosyltransferase
LRGIDDAIAAAGPHLGSVRLDSGDLDVLARAARAKLDAAGLRDARILVSSGLDEHEVARLVDGGAPIDLFGVGENITEPVDAPITGIIYKIVRNDTYDVDVAKRSSGGKATRPGVKQVYRQTDHDLVCLANEPSPGGRSLIERVMTGGLPLASPSIEAARARCAADIAALPPPLRAIPADPDASEPAPYPVIASAALEAATRRALDDASTVSS